MLPSEAPLVAGPRLTQRSVAEHDKNTGHVHCANSPHGQMILKSFESKHASTTHMLRVHAYDGT